MRNLPHFIFFIFISLYFGCTPKTTEKISEKEVKEVKVMTQDQIDCRTFADLGNKSEEALTAFVLYKDQLKAGNFQDAYPLWQKAFRLAPKADGSKTYHYDDGVKIFSDFYQNASTATEKRMWVDSVKFLYQRREKCYGDDGTLAARQGFDMYYNFKEEVGNQYIFDLFKKSSDKMGDKLPYFAVNPFAAVIVDMMGDKSLDKETASKYALNLFSAIDYGNKNCGDKCEVWEIINSYAPDRLEALEGYAQFYDCNYYYSKYYPQFVANKTDCEIIELVGIRLRRGGCSLEEAYMQEINNAYKSNCKEEEVVVKGPLAEAYDLYRAGKYDEAVVKFDEYLAIETDSEMLGKINLLVAKIYYRDLKNFSKSRKYALEAAKNKSNWGDPYILIGKLYASSGPLCGPGTGFDSQIVTWPAIDKWAYAKSIDSSVSSEADKLISTYRKYMPSIEDIFSRGLKEGASFTVGCWIQESTTVRIAK